MLPRKDKETHFLDLEEVLVTLDNILIFDKDNSIDYTNIIQNKLM